MVIFGTKKDVSPYKCLVGIVGSGSRGGTVPKLVVPDPGDGASASRRRGKG